MAFFEELMIQGIRAYPIDRQTVIKFLDPITVVQGRNGSGKTTVIESLCAITTGGLPSGQKQAFLHSVDFARVKKVDAMIKLRFSDKNGSDVIATSRMTNTSKEGKQACKSDEQTIKIIDSEGKTASLSAKNLDFKREMINLLGIPRAVLENVIFCHQENSCWPLAAPKDLKATFDEIFQMTQYVKFAAQIGKRNKTYKTDLDTAVARAQGAAAMHKEMIQKLERLSNLEVMEEECLKREDQLRKGMAEASAIITDAAKRLREMESTQTRYVIANERMKGLRNHRAMITATEFTGTEEELNEMMREMERSAEFRGVAEEQKRIAQRIQGIDSEMGRKQQQKRAAEGQLASVKATEIHRERVHTRLAEQVESLSSLFSIPAEGDIEAHFEDAEIALQREAAAKKEILNAELDKLRRTFESAEQELMEVKIEMKNVIENARKAETEIEKLRERIADAGRSHHEVPALKRELAELEGQKEAEGEAPKEREMQKTAERRQALSAEMDTLREELKESTQWAEVARDRARLTAQKDEAENKVDALKVKHKNDMTAVFGKQLDGLIGAKVEEASSRLKKGVERARGAAQNAAVTADRADTALRAMQKEKEELAEQAAEMREKISQCTNDCDADDVEWRLEQIRSNISNIRSEMAPLDATVVLYGKWTEQTRKSRCCPLCDRKFNNNQGAEALAEKLSNLTLEMPAKVVELGGKLKAEEEEEREFAKALSYVETLSLLERRAREKEMEMEEAKRVKEQRAAEAEKAAAGLAEVVAVVDAIQRIKADASLYDSQLGIASKSEEDLQRGEKEWMRHGKSAAARLDSSTQLLVSKEKELADVISEGDRMQTVAAKINSINQKMNSLRERIVSLGEDEQQRASLEEALQKAEEEKKEREKRREYCKQMMPRLSQAREAARSSRAEKEDQLRKTEGEAATALARMSHERNNYISLKEELQKLDGGPTPEECERAAASLEMELDELRRRKANADGELKNVGKKQTRKRELEEQQQLFELNRQMKAAEEELEECSHNEEDLEKWRGTIQKEEKKRREMERQIGEVEGRMKAVADEKKGLKTRLAEKDMQGVEKRLVEETARRVVLESAIQDIESYLVQLERCMIDFHQEKMEAINAIVDDLWRNAYKATDIETIRIVSEQSSVSENKGRKTYNYRVIMRQPGGLETDMRDRCSAGQKMLACLIIRLALADVFGSNCSTIALDEPTTNLDIEKIESMADMINDLVQARSSKQNRELGGRRIQMIIITHDAKFVDRIRLACRPEFIYRVSKDDLSNCSVISRVYTDGHVGEAEVSEELMNDEEEDERKRQGKKKRGV